MVRLRRWIPLLALALLLVAVVQVAGMGSPGLASAPVSFTVLHTNDFHGRLEPDGAGRGGSAHMATAIDDIRSAEGAANVILLDAGDIYFGAPPISQLSLGEATIDIYNMLGYDAAAYGNHEFDKGETVLISRTLQSDFPWLGANIVLSGTEWTHPWWARPYITLTVGASDNTATLGIIGLDTDAVPEITVQGATEGLAFKDLTEAVLHYYDEVAAKSDGLIVLAHQGTHDRGTYDGMQTIAQNLLDAGKPVGLIIGGHQHEALHSPVYVGATAIIEAGSYGKWLGRADVTLDPATQHLSLDHYELITITTAITAEQEVEDRVAYWAGLVEPLVERVMGSTYIELTRAGADEWNLGNLVTDGMRWKADLLDDGQLNGTVEVALTNAGGLREDITIPPDATLPYTITWGDTFNVMPFGNTLYLMDLTGAQLQAFLQEQAASPGTMTQISGAAFSYYNDCSCSSPAVWGSYGVQVQGEPLEYGGTYRIVTNNFAAGGGILAEGTDRLDTYYDMQEGTNDYLATISPVETADIMMGRMTSVDAPRPNLVSSNKEVVDANGDSVAAATEFLTYTITLSNMGHVDAGLLLTDTLDSGVTYVPGSLEIDFPGVGFVADVSSGVLTAHTGGFLSPPSDSGLPSGQSARISYAVQVSDPAPFGDFLSNAIELQDQFSTYRIAPATIALPPTHRAFLPLVVR